METGMDIRFAPHNLHLDSPEQFASLDPHLKVLSRQALVWDFPLIQRLPVKQPGIYTISGGRQIGKTTLLKQLKSNGPANCGRPISNRSPNTPTA
jgi:hypothetical protein